MARVVVFIDGFNVYHSIARKPHLNQAKWLNYRAFAQQFVKAPDTLDQVLLFTSYTFWDPDKEARHRAFTGANEVFGVRIMLGRFKMKDHKCRACKTVVPTPVEKMTDVNIASWLFRLACTNEYDKAILVSGDSDLVPAVEAVKTCFPEKNVGVLFPFERHSVELKDICDFVRYPKEKHFLRNQLPETVISPDGTAFSRPPEWK